MSIAHYITYYESPLGTITLTAAGDAITGLWMENQPKKILQDAIVCHCNAHTALQSACIWLNLYFSGEQPKTDTVILRPHGTAFQKSVWNKLLAIPYGQTVSYGQIAKEIAQERNVPKMSAQAVGNAVGKNPISIIIPCHRVIGANGKLVGYAGGLSYKQFLLTHEANHKK